MGFHRIHDHTEDVTGPSDLTGKIDYTMEVVIFTISKTDILIDKTFDYVVKFLQTKVAERPSTSFPKYAIKIIFSYPWKDLQTDLEIIHGEIYIDELELSLKLKGNNTYVMDWSVWTSIENIGTILNSLITKRKK